MNCLVSCFAAYWADELGVVDGQVGLDQHIEADFLQLLEHGVQDHLFRRVTLLYSVLIWNASSSLTASMAASL